MNETRSLQDKVKLLEKELATLTDKLDRIGETLDELEDVKFEIKAFKLFVGRRHPEFKKEIQEIVKKLRSAQR